MAVRADVTDRRIRLAGAIILGNLLQAEAAQQGGRVGKHETAPRTRDAITEMKCPWLRLRTESDMTSTLSEPLAPEHPLRDGHADFSSGHRKLLRLPTEMTEPSGQSDTGC